MSEQYFPYDLHPEWMWENTKKNILILITRKFCGQRYAKFSSNFHWPQTIIFIRIYFGEIHVFLLLAIRSIAQFFFLFFSFKYILGCEVKIATTLQWITFSSISETLLFWLFVSKNQYSCTTMFVHTDCVCAKGRNFFFVVCNFVFRAKTAQPNTTSKEQKNKFFLGQNARKKFLRTLFLRIRWNKEKKHAHKRKDMRWI